MGFDPQTAGQPIVDVHKRTTKVNLVVALAVLFFLLAGVGGAIWASKNRNHKEPALAGPGK